MYIIPTSKILVKVPNFPLLDYQTQEPFQKNLTSIMTISQPYAYLFQSKTFGHQLCITLNLSFSSH